MYVHYNIILFTIRLLPWQRRAFILKYKLIWKIYYHHSWWYIRYIKHNNSNNITIAKELQKCNFLVSTGWIFWCAIIQRSLIQYLNTFYIGTWCILYMHLKKKKKTSHVSHDLSSKQRHNSKPVIRWSRFILCWN